MIQDQSPQVSAMMLRGLRQLSRTRSLHITTPHKQWKRSFTSTSTKKTTARQGPRDRAVVKSETSILLMMVFLSITIPATALYAYKYSIAKNGQKNASAGEERREGIGPLFVGPEIGRSTGSLGKETVDGVRESKPSALKAKEWNRRRRFGRRRR